MGNRAVIAFSSKKSDLGIYLHWNGGIESVAAFLDAAKKLGLTGGDVARVAPRLVQIIGNFIGGTDSVYLGKVGELDCDNGDNGLFIVDPQLMAIVSRHHVPARAAARPFDKEYFEGVRDSVLDKNQAIFARP